MVSDLHLGEGRDLHTGRYRRNENFFADSAFRRFLSYHDPQRAGSAALVLNGDTFDFDRITTCPEDERELRDWGCYLSDLGTRKTRGELAGSISPAERRYGLRTNEFKSVWKLTRISRGHRGFFEALGWWVERGGWIVFVKGDHDLELHWTLVQDAIRREIGRAHPDAQVERQVLFRDSSLQVRNVYVEHGHRFDPMAAGTGAPTVSGGRELTRPVTSLITRYLTNPLGGVEPFLDNVKPVQRFLWTLVRRHPLKAPAILRHLLPVLKESFKPRRLEETAWLAVYCASLALPLAALALIALTVAGLLVTGSMDRLPVDLLATVGIVGLAGPYAVGLLRHLVPTRQPRVGEDRYAERVFWALHRSPFPAGCAKVFGVLGHTHRSDVQRLERIGPTEVLYVNAGSWTPTWHGDRSGLSGLVRYTFLRFDLTNTDDYELTYLEWDDERNEPVATTILEPRTPRPRERFSLGRERRTVEAFAETFLDIPGACISAGEVAGKVETYLTSVRTSQVRRLRFALRMIEHVVPLPALRSFSKLSQADRKRAIQRRFTRSPRSWLRKEVTRLRALCLVAYYGDERSAAQIGFIPLECGSRNGEDGVAPAAAHRLRLADPRGEVLTCDVCVVGSGAAGSVIASRAAAMGRDVVLIDKGRYLHGSEIGHDGGALLAAMYRDGGLARTLHLDWGVAEDRSLGGDGAPGNAVSFRLIRDPDLQSSRRRPVLDQWRQFGAAIDEATLGEAFERVEERLRVERLSAAQAGENGRLLLEGWRRLLGEGLGNDAFAANFFRQREDRSVGFGLWSYGCPDRRWSTLDTFMADAIAHGARVIPACRAEAIEHDASTATTLRCRLNEGSRVRIRARRVVIACGSIGSTVLLRRSGIRRNVGSRVSPNVMASVYARFSRSLNGFDGAALGAFVDSGFFILQSAFRPPAAFAVALPGWFETHADRMNHYSRLAAGNVLIWAEPSARVRRPALSRDWLGPLAYRMAPTDFQSLCKGIAILAQVYFAAGAESVYLGAFQDLEMPGRDFAPRGRINPGKIERYIARHVTHPADLMLESPFIQGGNPMSDDPRVGAVDSRFRVHGFENLYVCDASVFPTSTRCHPELTVMAMADYAWRTSIGADGND